MSDDSDQQGNEQVYIDLENGHYDGGSEQNSSSSSSSVSDEEEEQPEISGEIAFDTNLPTTHRYLGKLENVSGYTLYDDGQIIPNMLAIHTNTMVFPGFTLPLVMKISFQSERMIEEVRKGFTFVLINTDGPFGKIFEIGVIMEVFETSFKRGSLNLKAKGRQRCIIVAGNDIRPVYNGLHRVTVRVLGEPVITSPVCNTELKALKAKRPHSADDYDTITKNYKYRRYHLAQYPFSSWVYDHNELSFFVKHIVQGLLKYYVKDTIPTDPLVLSYWFVQNFQLQQDERLKILCCNSVLERLRLELQCLKMQRMLCCAHCKVDIAKQTDVFAMSKEGVQSNYCNPGGQVYETVTVLEAKNFDLVGEPSKQFSWFPGYWWTIMQCHICKTHLGWKFTSKHHQPPQFYGLANSGLVIKTFNEGVEVVELE